MERTDHLASLKLLTANPDVFSVARDVQELRQQFEDAFLEMERRDQIARLDAAEKGLDYEGEDLRSLKKAFNEEYMAFRDRLKVQTDLKNALENEHLQQKKALIERLRKTIQEEEKIGAAMNTFKEIQDSWKEIGDIPRNKREEVQKEYSRLLEQFFYNLKIYKQLKDHDLRRNQQLKEDIIKRLDELQSNTSVKETEQILKSLQNEWEDIGPVQNEEWERLKTEYWTAVRGIYERIHAYYDERRNTLKENILKKQELLKEADTLLQNVAMLDSAKAWEQETKRLLDIQDRWRKIGFGTKKENEEVYKVFRGLCDEFFAARKAFFATVNEGFKELADKKQKLIEKAESLMISTDWKNTSEEFIRLQKEWKKIGSAGPKLEQKLWNKFRAACDHFFNAKQDYFAGQEKELEVNLLAKQELIKEISSFKPSGDKNADLTSLKEFGKRFSELGQVPMKEKESVFKAYKEQMDTHYAAIKLDATEKERILFEARIETLAASADPTKAYAREKAEIRQQIDRLRSEMLQLENNLGFFARSKGADALRNEVEGKIQAAGNRIEALKRKLKLIPNE
ncbi:MAG: hypothetical protein RIT43_1785 [Bacteroidota bacterium]